MAKEDGFFLMEISIKVTSRMELSRALVCTMMFKRDPYMRVNFPTISSMGRVLKPGMKELINTLEIS
jgi:hypothetical protein